MAYQTSQGLASLGRNGDSVLVHMNPTEVAGLQSLAMSQGGSLTINPDTGLPEAFSLGGFFSSLLPMFAGAMFPGAGFAMEPLLAGALTGGALAGAKGQNPFMGALTGGLGGMSGSNLSFGLGAGSGAGAVESAGPGALSTEGAANMGNIGMANTFNTGAGTTLGQAGTYSQALNPTQYTGAQSMMANPVVRNAIQATQQAGSILPNTGSFMDKQLTALSNAGAGAGNLITGEPGAFDAFKNAYAVNGAQPLTNFQAATKIGMPIGGALLGGLEPSDLYGEPINMDEAKKKQAYDPNRSLNLSNDTGLRLYANGGAIAAGGIRDLYGSTDNPEISPPPTNGYGLGRLNNLASQQAQTQAQTYGYAMGGPVSFADGGDSNKEDAMGLPSLSPDMSMDPNVGPNNPAMIQSIMSAMQPMQGMQGSTPVQGQMPDQNNDSLIAKVTANLKADPNYQPTNPIEASIVKQIKGSDPMQQGQPSLQGLGSLAPSQPMAPSYNPSVAMGPTYFAGMNAPRGFAEGGDTGMNLDALPSLNLNTGAGNSSNLDPNSEAYFQERFGQFVAKLNRDPYYPRTNAWGYPIGDAPTGGPINPAFGYPAPASSNAGRVSKGTALNLNSGKQEAQYAHGGYLDGQGDGMSDSIPATIEGKQPARLADGEFVVPADVVSHIGNGSSKAGSQRLYSMLDKVRKARTGHTKQGKQINPNKYMPA